MDGLTLIAFTLGGFLLVFLLTTLFALVLRGAVKGQPALPPDSRPPGDGSADDASWFAILAGSIAKPTAVLLLTWLALRLVRDHPGTFGDPVIDLRYIKAWYLFWLTLLFLNGNEALGRLFYHVRKRRFPVSGMLVFLLRMGLIGVTAFLILRFVLDFDTSHLLTSTAVVAAVVGFALREVLSNFLAGVSLNLVGTVEPSQWIAVGDKEGEIIQRNWRETRLRTTGGHILIVPNGLLANGIINNMTWHAPVRRHQLSVTLMFDSHPLEVKAALVEAALGVEEVDRCKTPDAYIQEYRDYGVVYLVRFWSRTYHDRTRLEGTVRERIWYQLRRRGLAIPFPQGGDLSVACVPGALTGQEPDATRNERLLLASGFLERTLEATPGRPVLTPEEVRLLAGMLRYRIYGPGEVIFRQGDAGGECYILVSGRVIGSIRYEGLTSTHDFVIDPGELVGEMALLADLPRSATVRAGAGEVELLEFSREFFYRFLEHPLVGEVVMCRVARRSKRFFEELQLLEPGVVASPAPS